MTGDQRVEVSESGGSVLVNYGRIDGFAVIVDEIVRAVQDLVLRRVLQADEDRQPLVVSYVLVLRYADSARFLVDGFVVPMRIQLGQSVGYPVMLSVQNDLQHG